MTYLLLAAAIFLAATQSSASWYEKKIDGKLLYDLYKEAGVPTSALERTFEFLDLNENKEFKVKINLALVPKKIANKEYAIIIDYTKPSSSRRLYFLDLKTGKVEKYFVAHGVNSGSDKPSKFSNLLDSKTTSLGFYLTGSIYQGSHGESLYLHGLEKSNDRAFERAIVMHGAPYVSMEFLEKYGRMGRSWGCPAVSDAIRKKILPAIKNGAVLYAFHQDLMPVALTSPTVQEMGKDQTNTAANSDQIMPEEFDP